MGADRSPNVGRGPEFRAGARSCATAPRTGRPPSVRGVTAPQVASATVLAQLARRSPQERRAMVEALNARVGNRAVARAVEGEHHSVRVARSPTAPGSPGLPAEWDAVVRVLSTLGLDTPQVAVFARGDPVLFQLTVEGHPPTIAVLQYKSGVLRGGIFSIHVEEPKAALKAFMQVRSRVLDVARAMRLPEFEMLGVAVHNEEVAALLVRQGFVRSTEILPASAGIGPETEIEVYSKRFAVRDPPSGGGGGGGGGGKPPVGGAGAPPAAEGGGSPSPSSAGPTVSSEATEAERATVTVEQILLRGGETAGALAKLGAAAGVVADLLLPGPLDALLLFASFASVYGQNRAEARGRGMHVGFAEGLAARLVFSSEHAWQLANNELRPKTVDRDVLKEVAGTVGAFEGGELEGLRAGLRFGDQISPEQRKRFLHVAQKGVRANSGAVWTKEKAERASETWYTKANVEALAMGLRPTLDALLDQQEAIAALQHAVKLLNDPIEQAKAAWKLIVG